MNVTCQQIEEWLLDFVSGELAAETCHHVRLHLECCPPCVLLVETYQVTIKMGGQLRPRTMPPSLEAKLRQMQLDLEQGQRRGAPPKSNQTQIKQRRDFPPAPPST